MSVWGDTTKKGSADGTDALLMRKIKVGLGTLPTGMNKLHLLGKDSEYNIDGVLALDIRKNKVGLLTPQMGLIKENNVDVEYAFHIVQKTGSSNTNKFDLKISSGGELNITLFQCKITGKKDYESITEYNVVPDSSLPPLKIQTGPSGVLLGSTDFTSFGDDDLLSTSQLVQIDTTLNSPGGFLQTLCTIQFTGSGSHNLTNVIIDDIKVIGLDNEKKFDTSFAGTKTLHLNGGTMKWGI